MLWFTQVELPAPEPPGQPGKPHHKVTFYALEFALGNFFGSKTAVIIGETFISNSRWQILPGNPVLI